MPFRWLACTLAGYTEEGLLAAPSAVRPAKPTLPKWLVPLIPSATISTCCILGTQRLQKQVPVLAVFNYCSELDWRKDFPPLQRKSNKIKGAAQREAARGRAQVEPPPRAGAAFSPTRDLQSCMHELPCNGHSAVILSGPFTNRITGLILKSLSLSLPSLIFAEMDLQWKYLKRNNYLYEQQQHNACSVGVGRHLKKWVLSLKSAFIHVYVSTKSQIFVNTYKIFYGYNMILNCMCIHQACEAQFQLLFFLC